MPSTPDSPLTIPALADLVPTDQSLTLDLDRAAGMSRPQVCDAAGRPAPRALRRRLRAYLDALDHALTPLDLAVARGRMSARLSCGAQLDLAAVYRAGIEIEAGAQICDELIGRTVRVAIGAQLTRAPSGRLAVLVTPAVDVIDLAPLKPIDTRALQLYTQCIREIAEQLGRETLCPWMHDSGLTPRNSASG